MGVFIDANSVSGLHHHREEFNRLAQHPWFNKVWTLQGLYFARDPVFVYGKYRYSPNDLLYARTCYARYSSKHKENDEWQKLANMWLRFVHSERVCDVL